VQGLPAPARQGPQAAYSSPADHSHPSSHVHVDLVGFPTSASGYIYLLTFIDGSSRWVEAWPIKNMETILYKDTFLAEWGGTFWHASYDCYGPWYAFHFNHMSRYVISSTFSTPHNLFPRSDQWDGGKGAPANQGWLHPCEAGSSQLQLRLWVLLGLYWGQ
jgi:hypothetical protein